LGFVGSPGHVSVKFKTFEARTHPEPSKSPSILIDDRIRWTIKSGKTLGLNSSLEAMETVLGWAKEKVQNKVSKEMIAIRSITNSLFG
jgi:hypothetical protein